MSGRLICRCLSRVLVLLAAVWAVGIPAGAEPTAVDTARSDSTIRQRALATVTEAYAGSGPTELTQNPIGVFDSGTGGLAVLETILTMDAFDNQTGHPVAGGDGRADFVSEWFIFLADQANMPYGNYPSVGKAEFLRELIIKDAEFLLGNRYFRSADDEQAACDKLPVKAVVIACNTATAYGKHRIEELIAAAGLDVEVVGVIDGGAKGALEVFSDGKSGTIGVLPTRGTALSGAYPRAIRAEAKRRGVRQRIDVVQQGAFGLAGAIDGAPEYIMPGIEGNRPRQAYQGPSLDHPFARIDRAILRRYAFDFSGSHMLLEGSPRRPTVLQLNSVENYVAYHVVSLLESVRKMPDPKPLRTIILACTHFPFYADVFRRELKRLYEYREEGEYVYRDLMAADVKLIDPAYYTARELYSTLAVGGRMSRSRQGLDGRTRGEFYITVPRRAHPGVEIDSQGWFTYEYKYGRRAGHVGADYRAVLLRRRHLDRAALERLRRRAPSVWKMMEDFRARNEKFEVPVPATVP